MSFEDIEIYSGKKASDLFKDIVTDVDCKQAQIEILVSELKSMVKTVNDAILIVPLLKSYLEVGIKNNDERVKLASIVQKLMTAEVSGDESNALGLSDQEKDELLSELDAIEVERPQIDAKLEELKKEKKKITLNIE
jgi:hypothetical protein